MRDNNETPEMCRERLKQEESKSSMASSAQGSGLPDLVGGLSWKGTGILVTAMIIGFIAFLYLFN
ncbi:hypothetical protein J2Z58_001045 [Halobacillus andaensis]|nr:hypothetical protein [Halobacillus andaensis]